MKLINCISIALLCTLVDFSSAEITVISNLAVVGSPESHVGTPNKTLYANIQNLWCGAQNLGEHIDVEYGEFTRLSDGKVFKGTVNQGKVYLEIGKASVKVAGRYRCEVRTLDKEIHSGNLIIYMPPVLDFPAAVRVSEVLNARPPHVIGAERRGLHGERMVLECPVLANPEPMVRWEKNGEPLGNSDSIEYDGNNLILNSLTEDHIGKYRCIGDNSFPLFVDGPAIPHQIYFDQDIKVL
ncbi:Zwei Ig domain protein zig-7 [Caenorhabditis elegans]|uniref:Zwei Ig domain protein zig-7 n=1 Tax=Caenorhabditis elegans TaxID=6239 RepID=ZIG7_CAEEL|nr:Zwei Ig domain protein zig-7 [Caenorhabditis elegans]O44730.3 RecName: Full=Zwei Ig domain protein zig-7; AltName: Full=2 Ig domain protein zig-7; Flags: Precursor [Caenorhabditis elegans]CCD68970.1 Zwei Ig domain protein zig-7 [Caenorhabditis elegans]|eukprot:NP_491451.2 Zwei Ig domain protein zig-7 [Caenorhabditis elegans]